MGSEKVTEAPVYMAFRVCSEAAVKNCEAQPNDPHDKVPPIVSKSSLSAPTCGVT